MFCVAECVLSSRCMEVLSALWKWVNACLRNFVVSSKKTHENNNKDVSFFRSWVWFDRPIGSSGFRLSKDRASSSTAPVHNQRTAHKHAVHPGEVPAAAKSTTDPKRTWRSRSHGVARKKNTTRNASVLR